MKALKAKPIPMKRIKEPKHLKFKTDCDLYNLICELLEAKYPRGIPDKEQEITYRAMRLFQLDEKPAVGSSVYLLCRELGISEELYK
ncbi:hypothetical protein [Aeromonas sp.]|uniref:hypothetical protein n=1 Tax=Aeromonas sp. TaxID=647 RepID=UPI0025875F92|nr:hypothetical protein [Aeromonas sp.]MCX7128046.1 hypothetical protein [Aeromonas sp.]